MVCTRAADDYKILTTSSGGRRWTPLVVVAARTAPHVGMTFQARAPETPRSPTAAMSANTRSSHLCHDRKWQRSRRAFSLVDQRCLLVAQRHHRINLHGPPRRQVTG